MSSFPTSILLLIAVAFGQIFGGVSCCCLSRSLLDGWASAGTSIESETAAPKCPRCAAAAPQPCPANDPRPIPPVEGFKSNDANQCDCVEHALEADRPSEGGTATETSPSWAILEDLSSRTRAASSHVVQGALPPLRSHGISWQALAYKWTT
ncbi:hypothetical protein VN12_00655 [Pirellula sp. SH-Sr6A]|nr:hypothetical protein VN12_00655 [Pirellula sp. SH-Sr6A]